MKDNAEIKDAEKETKSVLPQKINLVKTCIVCITIIVALVIVIFIIRLLKPVTAESLNIVLSQRFVDKSELITESIVYSGEATYSSGKIPLIDKKSVTIAYEAEIKAGIDPSEIKVLYVTNDTVGVSVPKSKVISQAVDLNSVEIIDEDYALFGDKKSEVMKEANKTAQNNIDQLVTGKANDSEKLKIEELLDKADQRVDTILQGIFKGAIGNRKIEIIR